MARRKFKKLRLQKRSLLFARKTVPSMVVEGSLFNYQSNRGCLLISLDGLSRCIHNTLPKASTRRAL